MWVHAAYSADSVQWIKATYVGIHLETSRNTEHQWSYQSAASLIIITEIRVFVSATVILYSTSLERKTYEKV